MSGKKIAFFTREPMLHQMGGSTTYALQLLDLLRRTGADVTVVVLSAYSRSPRLWFRARTPLPEGVRYAVPGTIRFGSLYVQPFSARAWARLLTRVAARANATFLTPISSAVHSLFGDRLFTGAWDLTPMTSAERRVALRWIRTLDPATVIVNYCFNAPLFSRKTGSSENGGTSGERAPELRGRRCVILMHDLLSARVAKFLSSGIPLDCPPIDQATEIAWLDCADFLLAAQAREAEAVQPLVRSRVVVQPVMFTPRAARGTVDPRRCLFVGSNIAPNKTGLAWFLEAVWPQVLAADPESKLAVVGSICATLSAVPPSVELLGLVPDIEAEYARAAVCVIPLLVGSGIKIKLLEALAFGKATVSTTIGVQGMEDWVPGVVDVTDDATTFAASVHRLLTDPAERTRREQASLALAEQHFGSPTSLPPDFTAAVLG